ncbi:MAG: tetratricopeptide repeat protein [Acidobacteria bacterium]|nr:tetratricopeptide repeat protein [Acidobacteriota bacterium]
MKRTKYLKLFVYVALLFSIFSLAVETQAQPSKKEIEKARKIAKQGDQFFNQKDYRGAINKYAEAIMIVPRFPAAHFWKAYAHYYLNESEQALNELNLSLDQGFEKPLEIYKLRWYLNYEAKNYDAALSDALEAARLDPNNATYNLAAGDIYRMKESWAEAVNYYKKAAAQDPNNSDVDYYMAVCYANLGQWQDQGFAALEALKKKTKYVGESYFYVADALNRGKKYDEAAQAYEKAIQLKPEIYGAYNALSDIYRSRNEFDRAIETARKGLKLYPQDANLYTSLAWYYSLADRPQDAIIAGKSAINLQPDLAMAHTNLCRAYNDNKDYQLAIQTCNNALRLNPGDGETYLYMARAYEFLKQTDKALDLYKKAVDGLLKFTRDNPDYSDGFYLLGNAYFAIQKDNEAIAAYNQCLTLAPRFAKARFSLGYTYLINKDKVRAREQYNLLRQIDANLAEKLRQAIESTK